VIVEQLRGQLMGNLLSFPLLCLYNFCAFKYFVRRKVPLKINGDDIVFKATDHEYACWKDGLEKVGLRLSAGKTFVHRRFFSINSTYFWAHAKRVEELGVMRLGMLAVPDSCENLGKTHNVFVRCFRGKTRMLASALFLGIQRRFFKSGGRSLLSPSPMGFGVRTCLEALGRAGLVERECWYLENFSPRKEMRGPECVHNLTGVPEGWRRFKGRRPRRWATLESEFKEEMLELRWATPVVMTAKDRWAAYWDEARSYGGEGLWRTYVVERRSGLMAKGLRLLRGCGFKRSHHPMKLSLSFIHRAIADSRRGAGGGLWWGRRRVGELRFVRAVCGAVLEGGSE
jgi:hypothetical protein